MCAAASSCQVDSKQRIHAVRFSETPERIELGDIRTAYKASSPIRATSFSRRGILSKTRLTAPFEDHCKSPTKSTEQEQDDSTARSSSAPTTDIALVHKDSIELILKRGISMTSKSSGGGFLSMESKNNNKEPSPTKWKMRFWIPKGKDDDGSDNNPGQSKKETGFLQLLSESDILSSPSVTTEENQTLSELCGRSEENNEADNFIPEEYESSFDFKNSEVHFRSDSCCIHQPSVEQEEEEEEEEEEEGGETDGDEQDSKIPE